MTTMTTEAGEPAADRTAHRCSQLRGVNKSFGAVQVLHDVDLDRPARPGDRTGR